MKSLLGSKKSVISRVTSKDPLDNPSDKLVADFLRDVEEHARHGTDWILSKLQSRLEHNHPVVNLRIAWVVHKLSAQWDGSLRNDSTQATQAATIAYVAYVDARARIIGDRFFPWVDCNWRLTEIRHAEAAASRQYENWPMRSENLTGAVEACISALSVCACALDELLRYSTSSHFAAHAYALAECIGDAPRLFALAVNLTTEALQRLSFLRQELREKWTAPLHSFEDRYGAALEVAQSLTSRFLFLGSVLPAARELFFRFEERLRSRLKTRNCSTAEIPAGRSKTRSGRKSSAGSSTDVVTSLRVEPSANIKQHLELPSRVKGSTYNNTGANNIAERVKTWENADGKLKTFELPSTGGVVAQQQLQAAITKQESYFCNEKSLPEQPPEPPQSEPSNIYNIDLTSRQTDSSGRLRQRDRLSSSGSAAPHFGGDLLETASSQQQGFLTPPTEKPGFGFESTAVTSVNEEIKSRDALQAKQESSAASKALLASMYPETNTQPPLRTAMFGPRTNSIKRSADPTAAGHSRSDPPFATFISEQDVNQPHYNVPAPEYPQRYRKISRNDNSPVEVKDYIGVGAPLKEVHGNGTPSSRYRAHPRVAAVWQGIATRERSLSPVPGKSPVIFSPENRGSDTSNLDRTNNQVERSDSRVGNPRKRECPLTAGTTPSLRDMSPSFPRQLIDQSAGDGTRSPLKLHRDGQQAIYPPSPGSSPFMNGLWSPETSVQSFPTPQSCASPTASPLRSPWAVDTMHQLSNRKPEFALRQTSSLGKRRENNFCGLPSIFQPRPRTPSRPRDSYGVSVLPYLAERDQGAQRVASRSVSPMKRLASGPQPSDIGRRNRGGNTTGDIKRTCRKQAKQHDNNKAKCLMAVPTEKRLPKALGMVQVLGDQWGGPVRAWVGQHETHKEHSRAQSRQSQGTMMQCASIPRNVLQSPKQSPIKPLKVPTKKTYRAQIYTPLKAAASVTSPSAGGSIPADQLRAQIPEHYLLEKSSVVKQRPLGRGSTAYVYKGRWDRTTDVAIKEFSFPDGVNSVSGRARVREFYRELGTFLRLRHPNLVRIYGVIAEPLSLVMEYCSGGSLFDLLHGRNPESRNSSNLGGPGTDSIGKVFLTWPQKLKICADIATGISYLHTSQPQAIHRDLKSLNILLEKPILNSQTIPFAKITDFGLTRMKPDRNGWGALTGAAGTFQWMAPEVIRSQHYDEKADIFSFGILLFEILARQVPYRHLGPGNAGLSVVLGVAEGVRPDLSLIPHDCPPAIRIDGPVLGSGSRKTAYCIAPSQRHQRDFRFSVTLRCCEEVAAYCPSRWLPDHPGAPLAMWGVNNESEGPVLRAAPVINMEDRKSSADGRKPVSFFGNDLRGNSAQDKFRTDPRNLSPGSGVDLQGHMKAYVDAYIQKDERNIRFDDVLRGATLGTYVVNDFGFKVVGFSFGVPPELRAFDPTNDPLHVIPQLDLILVGKGDTICGWRHCTGPSEVSSGSPADSGPLQESSPGSRFEIKLSSEITAIGSVGAAQMASVIDDPRTRTSVVKWVLLIATEQDLQLFTIGVSGPNDSTITLERTRHVCRVPGNRVKCITGQNESGRLFFGDVAGAVFEFVYIIENATHNSWANSFFNWARHNPPVTLRPRTFTVNLLPKRSVLQRLIKRDCAVFSISCDEERGLIYAVHEDSAIRVTHFPPPIVEAGKFFFKGPTPDALFSWSKFTAPTTLTLQHHEAQEQMGRILRQCLRSEKMALDSHAALEKYVTWGTKLVKDARILRVEPLSRFCGNSIVAVAITDNASRIFLHLRSDPPIQNFTSQQYESLQQSNYPGVTNFSSLKAIEVVHFKPPPAFELGGSSANSTARLLDNACTVGAPPINANFGGPNLTSNIGQHYSAFAPGTPMAGVGTMPAAQMICFKNRTMLAAFASESRQDLLLCCVTADEGFVAKSRQEPAGGSSKGFREWRQILPLTPSSFSDLTPCTPTQSMNATSTPRIAPSSSDNTAGKAPKVLAIYEVPLHTEFRCMLERDGALPSPYNGPGRVIAQEVATLWAQRQAETERRASIRRSLLHSAPSSTRVSLAPWEMEEDDRICGSESRHFDAVAIARQRRNAITASLRGNAVPPSFLPPFAATQSVPAQTYVIITTAGVFHVQQNRGLDLLRDVAQALYERNVISVKGPTVEEVTGPLSEVEMLTVERIFSASRGLAHLHRSVLNPLALAAALTAEMAASIYWHTALLGCGIRRPNGPRRGNGTTLIAGRAADALSTQNSGTPFTRRAAPNEPTVTTRLNNLRSLIAPTGDAARNIAGELALDLLAHPALRLEFSSADAAVLQDPVTPGAISNSAVVKGLLALVARLLRPFWTCSIFEPGLALVGEPEVVNKSGAIGKTVTFEQQELIAPDWCSLPQISRGSPIMDVTSPVALLSMFDRNEDSSKLKRRRTAASNCHTNAGAGTRPETSDDKSKVLVLISRFTAAEFSKVRQWLTNLSVLIDAVAAELDLSPLQSKADAVSLRSISLFCQRCAQVLTLCNALAAEGGYGRVIPPTLFDIIVQRNLQQFVETTGVNGNYDAHLAALLAFSVVPVHILRSSCSLLFDERTLMLHCALAPLWALHKSVCRDRSADNGGRESIETLNLRRSGDVADACNVLLTSGTTADRTSICVISALLVELGLYNVLAEFVSRYAAAYVPQRDGGATADTPLDESTSSYSTSPLYREVLATIFFVVEDVLQYFYEKYINHETGKNTDSSQRNTLSSQAATAQQNALSLVQATLALPLMNSLPPPVYLARRWLHLTVLDWVAGPGERGFPAPLETLSSPMFPEWMRVHKADFGEKAPDVLSQFLLNSNDYDGYFEFTLTRARKTWPEPADLLKLADPNGCIPNGPADLLGEPTMCKPTMCKATMMSGNPLKPHHNNDENNDDISKHLPACPKSEFDLLDFKKHVCPTSSLGAHPPTRFVELWNIGKAFARCIAQGITIEERQAVLLKAKEGLISSLLSIEETAETKSENTFPGQLHQAPRISLKSQIASLHENLRRIDEVLNRVEAQAALIRETLEVVVFALLKYPMLIGAFSTDYHQRQAVFEECKALQGSGITHAINIQTLLYCLQWRLCDSPSAIVKLLSDFASASRGTMPTPGFSLLKYHWLAIAIPNGFRRPVIELSKENLIEAAFYSRTFAAIALDDSEIVVDMVARLVMLIESSPTSSAVLEASENAMPEVAAALLNMASKMSATLNRSHTKTSSPEQWWNWPLQVVAYQAEAVDLWLGETTSTAPETASNKMTPLPAGMRQLLVLEAFAKACDLSYQDTLLQVGGYAP